MRGLKKALLLAATRLPMDGKDIPGDAEKIKNWPSKRLLTTARKNERENGYGHFVGPQPKLLILWATALVQWVVLAETPCNVETSVNLAAAGDASAARARRVYR